MAEWPESNVPIFQLLDERLRDALLGVEEGQTVQLRVAADNIAITSLEQVSKTSIRHGFVCCCLCVSTLHSRFLRCVWVFRNWRLPWPPLQLQHPRAKRCLKLSRAAHSLPDGSLWSPRSQAFIAWTYATRIPPHVDVHKVFGQMRKDMERAAKRKDIQQKSIKAIHLSNAELASRFRLTTNVEQTLWFPTQMLKKSWESKLNAAVKRGSPLSPTRASATDLSTACSSRSPHQPTHPSSIRSPPSPAAAVPLAPSRPLVRGLTNGGNFCFFNAAFTALVTAPGVWACLQNIWTLACAAASGKVIRVLGIEMQGLMDCLSALHRCCTSSSSGMADVESAQRAFFGHLLHVQQDDADAPWRTLSDLMHHLAAFVVAAPPQQDECIDLRSTAIPPGCAHPVMVQLSRLMTRVQSALFCKGCRAGEDSAGAEMSTSVLELAYSAAPCSLESMLHEMQAEQALEPHTHVDGCACAYGQPCKRTAVLAYSSFLWINCQPSTPDLPGTAKPYSMPLTHTMPNGQCFRLHAILERHGVTAAAGHSDQPHSWAWLRQLQLVDIQRLERE